MKTRDLAASLAVALAISVQTAHAEADLVRLVENANPAVVVVSAYSESGTPLSQGSGVIVDPTGEVVTNNHVIADASVIVVRRPEADPVFATTVLATSDPWDVALLKIPGRGLPFLALAQPHSARVGMHVVAIGSPLGLENTISEGIISRIREESVLQVTTPISSGSSGGALLADSGRLLGLTTLTAQGGQNVNFAVPAEKIAPLLSATRDTPQRSLGRLSSVPSPRARGTTDAPYYRSFRTSSKLRARGSVMSNEADFRPDSWRTDSLQVGKAPPDESLQGTSRWVAGDAAQWNLESL